MKTIHKGNLQTSDLYIRSINKFLNRLVNKIIFYVRRPYALQIELNARFHLLKYNWLTYTDPPPPKIKNETDDEYFDRVDPKYGLRHYEVMVSAGADLDAADAVPKINADYKDEKTRKMMKELLMIFIEANQKNKEMYQKYLIRSKILKNQG